MKVLITGNFGYIGSILGKTLEESGSSVFGWDIGYFKDCLLDSDFQDIPTYQVDIRNIPIEKLGEFDCVVHLAGLSNDPLGEFNESLTYDINYKASVELARQSKLAGIKKFLFASTQSIYGISDSRLELDEDNSIKNPQTAYARSKWMAEQEILEMSDANFVAIAIRPSTVFGWSPRLRTDIVFNNILVNAFVNNKIEVHSDGTPWRPILHIKDLCDFISLCLNAEPSLTSGQAFNVGMLDGNFTVREIAESAARSLNKELPIIFNTENIIDPRSYRVSFEKAHKVLGFRAQFGLDFGGKEILNNISRLNLDADKLLTNWTTRIKQLQKLLDNSKIDSELRFIR